MYFKHILQIFSIYTFELGKAGPTFLHATPSLYREMNMERTTPIKHPLQSSLI